MLPRTPIVFGLLLLFTRSVFACEQYTVSNLEGTFNNERSWKILQNGIELVNGKGGETKTLCLSGGNYTVVGKDSYGDGWNGGVLKVVRTSDGHITFGPWSGPQNCPYSNRSPCKAEVFSTFSLCWVGWYGTWPNCTECPAGKYATNTGKEVDTACSFTSSTCPWGHYCVSSMRAAQRCPTGRYGNLIGQSTVAQACPNFCAPGKYSVLGNTEVTACIICPVAHYCDGNGSKTACAKGKFGLDSGTGKIRENETCLVCSDGKYADSLGASSCTTCPDGKYSNVNTTKHECALCALGKQGRGSGKIREAEGCEDCPSGKYASTLGTSSCKTCSSGQYFNGSKQDCALCPLGKGGTGYSSSKLTEEEGCEICPSGKYASTLGTSSCKTCSLGKYRNENVSRIQCIQCNDNTYQDETGKVECKKCTMGQYTTHINSTVKTPAGEKGILIDSIQCSKYPICRMNKTIPFVRVSESCQIAKTFVVRSNRNITIAGKKTQTVLTIGSGQGRVIKVEKFGKLTLENVTLSAERFASCSSTTAKDTCNVGGILLDDFGDLKASYVTFLNGHHHGDGGAIEAGIGCKIELQYCMFMNNVATGKGGALFSGTRSTLLLEFTEFRNNLAGYGSFSSQQGEGGSVYADADTVINAKDCIFQNNGKKTGTSSYYCKQGGAMFVGTNGNATFDRCTMNNSFAEEGGAIFSGSRSILMLDSTQFYGNGATIGGGVFIGSEDDEDLASLTILSSTFMNNIAEPKSGGGVYTKFTKVHVTSSLFDQNVAGKRGGGLCLEESESFNSVSNKHAPSF